MANLSSSMGSSDNVTKVEVVLNRMTLISVFLFCLFAYTSNAGLSLAQALMFLPGLYFFSKNLQLHSLSKSMWVLFLYCLAVVVSLLISGADSKFTDMGEIRNYIVAIFFVWALHSCFGNLKSGSPKQKKVYRVLLSTVLISTTLANVSGMIGLFTAFNPLRFAETTDLLRSTGMYSMAVTYGYGIQFFCIFLFFLLIYRQHFAAYLNRNLLYIAFFTSMLGLYFSYTRGAILGFMFGAPFVFLSRSSKLVKRGILFIVALLVTVVLGLYLNGGNEHHRLFQKLSSDSNLIRVSQYEAAWKGFLEKPVFGVGFRQFGPMSGEIKEKYDIGFKDFKGHAHNNFLEALVGTGVVGFILFTLFHVFWLRESYVRTDLFRSLFTPVVVTLIVSGLVQNTFTDSENIIVVMFFYSLSQVHNLFKTGKTVDAQHPPEVVN